MGKIFLTHVNVDLTAKSFPWSFIFLSEHTLNVSIYSGLVSLPQRCRILQFPELTYETNQTDSSSKKKKNYFRILKIRENFSWFRRSGELWAGNSEDSKKNQETWQTVCAVLFAKSKLLLTNFGSFLTKIWVFIAKNPSKIFFLVPFKICNFPLRLV